MVHSDGPVPPPDGHNQLPKKLQPVTSQASGSVPEILEGDPHREVLLRAMIWSYHDTWGPMSKPSRRREGTKGGCEALECPLAQKVDAQLDLEKVTKS